MVDEKDQGAKTKVDEVVERASDEPRSDSATPVNKTKIRKDGLEELSDLIVERSTSAHPTLKAVLAGSVELFVKDRPFRAVFDFTTNPTRRLLSGSKESDCIIETDERTLMRIHQGDLNPQLAMVSDKMNVKGKSGLAVYFFNLLGD